MHKLRTPNEEETIAEKLFYKNFYVYVKNKAFYTAFELEHRDYNDGGTDFEVFQTKAKDYPH